MSLVKDRQRSIQYGVVAGEEVGRRKGHTDVRLPREPVVLFACRRPGDRRDPGRQSSVRQLHETRVPVLVRAPAGRLAEEPGRRALLEVDDELHRRRVGDPTDQHGQAAVGLTRRVLESIQEGARTSCCRRRC